MSINKNVYELLQSKTFNNLFLSNFYLSKIYD